MTLDFDKTFIESEEIKNFGISNNFKNRALSVTIDEYDILKLNLGNAQELIDEIY